MVAAGRPEPAGPGRLMAGPDTRLALARYRNHAPGYDASAMRTMPMRRRTIERLDLRPGDTVLDVACGTGLSFELLLDGVGDSGHIIGVELSPEMLAGAAAKVQAAGWRNVTLIESDMASVSLPRRLDAILFNFTHDVLRSPVALANIFAAARSGARVAFAGMKYAPWWMAPVNLIVRAQARPYMTTFDGLDAPWNLAEGFLERFHRESALFGTAYIGWGRVADKDIERRDSQSGTESV